MNQVGECSLKDLKKFNALNFGKTTIFPPETKGAKIDATIP